MLERHGLADVPEESFEHDGWSGSRLTALQRGPERFILKRTSAASDWIVRATQDVALREGFVANAGLRLAEPLIAPYLGVGSDGEAVAILMPDLSDGADRVGRPCRRSRRRSGDSRPGRRCDRRPARHALGGLPADHRRLGLALVSAPRAPSPALATIRGALSRRRAGGRRAVPGRLGRLRATRLAGCSIDRLRTRAGPFAAAAGARAIADDRPARRPQARQRRPPRRRPGRPHRLADDEPRAGRGGARLAPRLELGHPADRAG